MRKKGENSGRIMPDKDPIKKARVVGTRISSGQAVDLEKLATSSNMTESTYIRHVIQRAISEGWVFKMEMSIAPTSVSKPRMP